MLKSVRSRASAIAFAVLAGAIAATPTTASAQDDRRRSETVSACLDRATTNVQMRACGESEYRRQDDRLNAEYQRAQARLTPSQFTTLRQEQRTWLRNRGSECRGGGGTNGALSAILCRASETENRADYLANYRAAGRPDGASLSAWTGRWQGPEGLFVDVQPGRGPNQVMLTLKDNLDDQGVYVGSFTGSSIQFQRRGRPEPSAAAPALKPASPSYAHGETV